MDLEPDDTASEASGDSGTVAGRDDSQKYAVNTLSRMNELRKKGNLCDVLVKVGDREFPAHRVVLAASSDYFDAMFASGMAESEQSSVELKGIPASVMDVLLDFMYTGLVRVSMLNVQDLLPAASLIQMEGVRLACSNFLYSEVEPGNVLGIRRFAELHNCSQLEHFAKNYAAHNFEIVAEFEEFLLLSPEEIKNLISREDLHIDNEETVYKSVLRWVYQDAETRQQELPELLLRIRLSVMSARFLTDIVDKEPLIRNCHKCRDFVDDAKKFHLRPDLRHEMRDKRFRQRNGADEYLVVIGGFGSDQSPSDSVEMFDPRNQEWTELPALPIRYRYVAACALGTCVYVIGGFDGRERLNTVGLLDITQRDDGWRWVALMHFKRGLAAACTHKGLIYVCGGFDGQSRLRSLEVYHPKIDEWRLLEEMVTAREGAGLVVADDNLYCLGGYDGMQLLSSMERYDPRRGSWSPCEPMYMRRSGAGCAVIGDTIYVCGGYGGAESHGPLHLDTVEAYNSRLGQWTLVVNMHVPRCYVGACQMAGKIYVAAGYDGGRLLDTVEAYDPVENIWSLYEENRMKHERCDTGMCVVRFLEFADVTTSGSGPPPVTAGPCTTSSTACVSSGNASGGYPQMPTEIRGGDLYHNVVHPGPLLLDEARGGPESGPSPAAPGGVSGSYTGPLVHSNSATASLAGTSTNGSGAPRPTARASPSVTSTMRHHSHQSVALVAPVMGRSVVSSSTSRLYQQHQQRPSASVAVAALVSSTSSSHILQRPIGLPPELLPTAAPLPPPDVVIASPQSLAPSPAAAVGRRESTPVPDQPSPTE